MKNGKKMNKEITYVITDIHGCLDQLNRAYDAIVEDAAGKLARVVFLGDAVDRGPDSKGVIDRLMVGAQSDNFLKQVNLLGNHEDFMIESLGGNFDTFVQWTSNGGKATLKSYGVNIDQPLMDIFHDFKDGYVPEEHISWLSGLLIHWENKSHYFVHAGLIPGLEPSDHDEHELHYMYWIRFEFLNSTFKWKKHVVHGHTPTTAIGLPAYPDFRENRTNLDTGVCFKDGKLSVGVFSPTETENPSKILQF